MADYFNKDRNNRVGPGGIRCSCCGGNRQDRIRATRATRARIKARDIREYADKVGKAG